MSGRLRADRFSVLVSWLVWRQDPHAAELGCSLIQDWVFQHSRFCFCHNNDMVPKKSRQTIHGALRLLV